jgi:hypothetical protein
LHRHAPISFQCADSRRDGFTAIHQAANISACPYPISG